MVFAGAAWLPLPTALLAAACACVYISIYISFIIWCLHGLLVFAASDQSRRDVPEALWRCRVPLLLLPPFPFPLSRFQLMVGYDRVPSVLLWPVAGALMC
jgi:hypothetical protein